MDVIRAYLAASSERAPDPPPGYYPVIPAKCPICHANVTFDIKLSSMQRGAGWLCEVGGSAHYWQRMGQASASDAKHRRNYACKRSIQQGLPVPEPLPAEGW